MFFCVMCCPVLQTVSARSVYVFSILLCAVSARSVYVFFCVMFLKLFFLLVMLLLLEVELFGCDALSKLLTPQIS